MIPVIFISTLLNIPKFLESKVIFDNPWDDLHDDVTRGENDTLIFANMSWNINNITEDEWKLFTGGRRTSMVPETPYIGVTELRSDANYMIYYTQWTQLFVKAIIPTVLLIYFNYKVSLRKSLIMLFTI